MYHPTHIQIRADLDGNGDTADANETIVYAYNGYPLKAGHFMMSVT
jgi:hypothetical protein